MKIFSWVSGKRADWFLLHLNMDMTQNRYLEQYFCDLKNSKHFITVFIIDSFALFK